MSPSPFAEKQLAEISVLLVEDNPSDAFMVGSLLDEIPSTYYRMSHVKTRVEALVMLARQSFDVCLLDLTLPDTNGFGALIEIQEKRPDLPVLMLAGVNDADLARRAVGRGAQDYLVKDALDLATLNRSIDYAIERKRIEQSLFSRVNHDALTGLVNGETFESRLGMALLRSQRAASGTAVVLINLDRFKPFNDTYGHALGDEVLKQMSHRFKESARSYDTIARVGGDAFAILFEGISSSRDAAVLAQKMLTMIALPFEHEGEKFMVHGSIGVVFSHVVVPPEEMMAHAYTALAQAKRDGGNSYRFHLENVQGATEACLKLENDVGAALLADEFQLSYQPYVSSSHRDVLGVETLLRWASPVRGLLFPHEFLPAAEAKQMMPAIGAWLGGRLMRDIRLWNAEAVPPLQIAINLSASQLEAPELLEWITPLTQPEFLGEHRLAVEVPADALAGMVPKRVMALRQLSALGVHLHLDQFNGGSLSLQTLLALPFSMLKLDVSVIQNMVDGMEGDTLISAAIILAHHMGIKVGAVGVEIPLQQRMLAERHCDVTQGFLMAHPMTASQIVTWLKHEHQRAPAMVG